MTDKFRKRLRALATLVKRDDYELVSERADLARALTLLRRHETALHEAGERVETTEVALRSALHGGDQLELASVQALRGYHHECQVALTQARSVYARSDAAATQLEQVVARRKAGIRAVERAVQRIDVEQTREVERQTGREQEDSWLQRRGSER